MATRSETANNHQMNLPSFAYFIVGDDSLCWRLQQLLNHKKTQTINKQLNIVIEDDLFER